MGCRGGTRTTEGKLAPHSERRLCGNDFWCGKNGRHFRVSNEVPSERPGGEQVVAEERKGDAGGSGASSLTAEEGTEIWFDGQMEWGRINDFVIAWGDEGKVHHHLLRDGSSCWLGAGEGPTIKWSTSGAWRLGSLEAARGLRPLSDDRAACLDQRAGGGRGSGLLVRAHNIPGPTT